MRNAVDTAPSLRNLERSLLEPDDVLELVEKALLDLLRFSADAAQLTQRLPLLLGQIGRDHDSDKDQLVAPASGPHMRDATTVDADRLSILGPGRNVDLLGPIHRWDFHRVAQGGLCHAQGQLIDDVGTVSLQHRVRLDLDDDVEVTGGTATRTDLAFTGEANLRPTIDAARDADPHFLFAGAVAAPAAGPAGFLDDLALAVATRAGGDIDDLSEAGPTEVETGHALRAGVAKAVIALTLGLVAQDLVGLVDFLEAGLGLRIVRIAVG